MKDIFKEYKIAALGLQTLLDSTRKYADSFPQKLNGMQENYLQRNSGVYSSTAQRELRYYLNAFSYKFYLATMHLEQLWGLNHGHLGEENLFEILENVYDHHQVDGDNQILYSLVLEGFLLQARAFYDFYILYICLFFQVNKTKNLSEKKFLVLLEGVKKQIFGMKPIQVKEHFEKDLPRKRRWLLKNLRDSAIHRDNLHPSFETRQTLLEKLTSDWVTQLKDVSCSRYCQDVQNDMFSLVVELSPVLYDLEWKPGPFRSDLWG